MVQLNLTKLTIRLSVFLFFLCLTHQVCLLQVQAATHPCGKKPYLISLTPHITTPGQPGYYYGWRQPTSDIYPNYQNFTNELSAPWDIESYGKFLGEVDSETGIEGEILKNSMDKSDLIKVKVKVIDLGSATGNQNVGEGCKIYWDSGVGDENGWILPINTGDYSSFTSQSYTDTNGEAEAYWRAGTGLSQTITAYIPGKVSQKIYSYGEDQDPVLGPHEISNSTQIVTVKSIFINPESYEQRSKWLTSTNIYGRAWNWARFEQNKIDMAHSYPIRNKQNPQSIRGVDYLYINATYTNIYNNVTSEDAYYVNLYYNNEFCGNGIKDGYEVGVDCGVGNNGFPFSGTYQTKGRYSYYALSYQLAVNSTGMDASEIVKDCSLPCTPLYIEQVREISDKQKYGVSSRFNGVNGVQGHRLRLDQLNEGDNFDLAKAKETLRTYSNNDLDICYLTKEFDYPVMSLRKDNDTNFAAFTKDTTFNQALGTLNFDQSKHIKDIHACQKITATMVFYPSGNGKGIPEYDVSYETYHPQDMLGPSNLELKVDLKDYVHYSKLNKVPDGQNYRIIEEEDYSSSDIGYDYYTGQNIGKGVFQYKVRGWPDTTGMYCIFAVYHDKEDEIKGYAKVVVTDVLGKGSFLPLSTINLGRIRMMKYIEQYLINDTDTRSDNDAYENVIALKSHPVRNSPKYTIDKFQHYWYDEIMDLTIDDTTLSSIEYKPPDQQSLISGGYYAGDHFAQKFKEYKEEVHNSDLMEQFDERVGIFSGSVKIPGFHEDPKSNPLVQELFVKNGPFTLINNIYNKEHGPIDLFHPVSGLIANLDLDRNDINSYGLIDIQGNNPDHCIAYSKSEMVEKGLDYKSSIYRPKLPSTGVVDQSNLDLQFATATWNPSLSPSFNAMIKGQITLPLKIISPFPIESVDDINNGRVNVDIESKTRTTFSPETIDLSGPEKNPHRHLTDFIGNQLIRSIREVEKRQGYGTEGFQQEDVLTYYEQNPNSRLVKARQLGSYIYNEYRSSLYPDNLNTQGPSGTTKNNYENLPINKNGYVFIGEVVFDFLFYIPRPSSFNGEFMKRLHYYFSNPLSAGRNSPASYNGRKYYNYFNYTTNVKKLQFYDQLPNLEEGQYVFGYESGYTVQLDMNDPKYEELNGMVMQEFSRDVTPIQKTDYQDKVWLYDTSVVESINENANNEIKANIEGLAGFSFVVYDNRDGVENVKPSTQFDMNNQLLSNAVPRLPFNLALKMKRYEEEINSEVASNEWTSYWNSWNSKYPLTCPDGSLVYRDADGNIIVTDSNTTTEAPLIRTITVPVKSDHDDDQYYGWYVFGIIIIWLSCLASSWFCMTLTNIGKKCQKRFRYCWRGFIRRGLVRSKEQREEMIAEEITNHGHPQYSKEIEEPDIVALKRSVKEKGLTDENNHIDLVIQLEEKVYHDNEGKIIPDGEKPRIVTDWDRFGSTEGGPSSGVTNIKKQDTSRLSADIGVLVTGQSQSVQSQGLRLSAAEKWKQEYEEEKELLEIVKNLTPKELKLVSSRMEPHHRQSMHEAFGLPPVALAGGPGNLATIPEHGIRESMAHHAKRQSDEQCIQSGDDEEEAEDDDDEEEEDEDEEDEGSDDEDDKDGDNKVKEVNLNKGTVGSGDMTMAEMMAAMEKDEEFDDDLHGDSGYAVPVGPGTIASDTTAAVAATEADIVPQKEVSAAPLERVSNTVAAPVADAAASESDAAQAQETAIPDQAQPQAESEAPAAKVDSETAQPPIEEPAQAAQIASSDTTNDAAMPTEAAATEAAETNEVTAPAPGPPEKDSSAAVGLTTATAIGAGAAAVGVAAAAAATTKGKGKKGGKHHKGSKALFAGPTATEPEAVEQVTKEAEPTPAAEVDRSSAAEAAKESDNQNRESGEFVERVSGAEKVPGDLEGKESSGGKNLPIPPIVPVIIPGTTQQEKDPNQGPDTKSSFEPQPRSGSVGQGPTAAETAATASKKASFFKRSQSQALPPAEQVPAEPDRAHQSSIEEKALQKLLLVQQAASQADLVVEQNLQKQRESMKRAQEERASQRASSRGASQNRGSRQSSPGGEDVSPKPKAQWQSMMEGQMAMTRISGFKQDPNTNSEENQSKSQEQNVFEAQSPVPSSVPEKKASVGPSTATSADQQKALQEQLMKQNQILQEQIKQMQQQQNFQQLQQSNTTSSILAQVHSHVDIQQQSNSEQQVKQKPAHTFGMSSSKGKGGKHRVAAGHHGHMPIVGGPPKSSSFISSAASDKKNNNNNNNNVNDLTNLLQDIQKPGGPGAKTTGTNSSGITGSGQLGGGGKPFRSSLLGGPPVGPVVPGPPTVSVNTTNVIKAPTRPVNINSPRLGPGNKSGGSDSQGKNTNSTKGQGTVVTGAPNLYYGGNNTSGVIIKGNANGHGSGKKGGKRYH